MKNLILILALLLTLQGLRNAANCLRLWSWPLNMMTTSFWKKRSPALKSGAPFWGMTP